MGAIKGLSKSRLTASLQCQRRLWLTAYKPELAEKDEGAERVFRIGHEIGALARTLYGPGTLIEAPDRKFGPALAKTRELISNGNGSPIFEATFDHDGLLVQVDVLRRRRDGDLEIVEVKSSSQAKDYQIIDAAIQAWVVRKCGYRVKRVLLAVVDTSFTYQGDGDYRGLLKEVDISKQVRPLQRQISKWIRTARATLANGEPKTDIGPHCSEPFDCAFYSHCEGPRVEYPVTILPHDNKGKRWQLRKEGYRDLREVPEEKLTSEKHLRVWRVSKSGSPEIDDALREKLKALPYPRYYVDFEGLNLAIPHWSGTRPYEQVPFQWSCHCEDREGELEHSEFLAVAGAEHPSREFAVTLLKAVGKLGPVITYSGYEKQRLIELRKRFRDLSRNIDGVIERIVDLLPPMRAHYYHPAMMGSWSIKSVLPTLTALSYDDLGIVQEGGAAAEVFAEMLSSTCSKERACDLRKALLDYCKLDTLALVQVTSEIQNQRG